ncbi:MAG: carboxypeptidase-like regulatory domain-containing protein, partial [Siphonobacter sp.]
MRFYTCLLYFLSLSTAWSQGIKGTIRNLKGEGLPYAALQVKGTTVGTMANAEGEYEITLPPGDYEVQFQYLNHLTLTRKVNVTTDVKLLNVALEEVAVKLAEVKVGKSKEDPAYTIMRKAITMARYHQLEVDSWSARTYVKGTFSIRIVP